MFGVVFNCWRTHHSGRTLPPPTAIEGRSHGTGGLWRQSGRPITPVW